VQTECLVYAISTGQQQGIWGGTNGRIRRKASRYLRPYVPVRLGGDVRDRLDMHIDPLLHEAVSVVARSEGVTMSEWIRQTIVDRLQAEREALKAQSWPVP
jgi:hypothetical protein